MTERKSLSGGDWAAIGTFLVGTLVAVLMAYGLWTGAGGASGTAAIGAAIAAAVGAWPALVGGAGVALLGARAFLTSERAGLLSGSLGVVGVGLGLSVVAGSFGGAGGGTLGAATGGRVAEMSHAVVGALLGAVVAFGAAYLAWMREDPAAAAKLAPARRLTPAPPKGDDGVSAAESAMLFPEEQAEAPARPVPAPKKPVQPLYPEDVRLKGEIPAGTKPLAGAAAGRTDADARALAGGALPAVAEPAVYRWTAPRANPAPDPTRIAAEEIEALADVAPPVPGMLRADDAADADAIAAEVVAEEPVVEERDERPMPPRPTWETTGLTEEDEPVDAYGTPLSLVEKARREAETEPQAVRIPRELDAPVDGDVEERDEAALEALEAELAVADEGVVTAAVVEELAIEERAVEDLANGELADEELASARRADAQTEPVLARADAEPQTEPVAAEVEDALAAVEAFVAADAPESVEATVESVEERAAALATPALTSVPAADTALDAEARAEALLEELRASNAALRAEAEAVEVEVAVAAEDRALEAEFEALAAEPDAIAELEQVLAAEAAEARSAPAEEVAEDEDVELFAEADAAEAAIPELAAAEAIEDLDEVLAREPEPEPEPVVAVAPAPRGKAAPAVAAPGLFDAVEEEREVVLAPQAAVPASRAEKAPGRGLDPEKKLLVEVGCMFVDRGRVAVSMLQRQYGMDFDAACRVLDDLQEMGLIGPYLGGKSRDILLTREQWMEKVGAS